MRETSKKQRRKGPVLLVDKFFLMEGFFQKRVSRKAEVQQRVQMDTVTWLNWNDLTTNMVKERERQNSDEL